MSVKIAHSKVTAQGQVSVPAEVRRRLGVGPGSVLEWDADGDAVTVRRSGRFTSEEIHAAIFPVAPGSKSVGDLKRGIASHVNTRHSARRHAVR